MIGQILSALGLAGTSVGYTPQATHQLTMMMVMMIMTTSWSCTRSTGASPQQRRPVWGSVFSFSISLPVTYPCCRAWAAKVVPAFLLPTFTALLPFMTAYNVAVNFPNILRQSSLILMSTAWSVRSLTPHHPPKRQA
jgi:hypothetical protein